MVKGLIYMCHCSITDKYYVGQTILGFERRKAEPISISYRKGNSLYNTPLHSDIRKYGPEKFNWKILIELLSASSYDLSESLNELEWYYIKKYNSYNNGYNLTRGGDNNNIKPARIIEVYNIVGDKLYTFSDILEAAKTLKIHILTIKSALNKLLNFIKKNYDRYVFKFEGDLYTEEEIALNLLLVQKEKIYVYNLFGELIDECLNLGYFCNKYKITRELAYHCLYKECKYLQSQLLKESLLTITKGEVLDKSTFGAFVGQQTTNKFFILVIDKNTGNKTIYSSLSKAAKQLNLNYRFLLRNLGEFKKDSCETDKYKIINLKYYDSYCR